ncbi:MAG: PIN domain-containing protein [Dermatophilaceae bacterium]
MISDSLEGVSLNSYLTRVLDQASTIPSRAEVVRRLQDRGNLVPVGRSLPDTVELIHELREERDRELMALSAYDAAYVSVAEALDAPLFARDTRLARTANEYVECHLV